MEQDNKILRKRWISIVLSAAFLILGFAAGWFAFGFNKYSISKSDYDFLKQMAPVKFAYETIVKEYYTDLQVDELIESAGDGMSSLLDRYSVFYSPEDYDSMLASSKGVNNSIGVSLIKINGEILIGNILSGSPASKAEEIENKVSSGLVEGDKLLSINGNEIVHSLSLSSVLNLLKSEDTGSEIIIRVERKSGNNVKTYSFRCITSEIAEVKCEFYDGTILGLPDNFGYIKLASFTGEAYNQFVDCINKFIKKYAEKSDNPVLILDLRNNGGGKVSILQKIAAYLIIDKNIENCDSDTSTEVMHAEYKNGDKTYFRTPDNKYIGDNIKLILLVNNKSASASEALVGAVKDWETGIVIGTHTFGKGIMQETFYDKATGYGIKLTTATFHSPVNSYCPQDNPWMPDYSPFETVEQQNSYLLNGAGVSGTSYYEDIFLKYTVDNIDML